MRYFSFIAVAALFGALAWGAEPASTTSGQAGESSLGETTKEASCPCRFLSENKRLEGDLGVGDLSGDGESDGSANPVK